MTATRRTAECLVVTGFRVEPPIGIEPMTNALRGARQRAPHALAAPIARVMARMALAALGLSGDPVHDPIHARGLPPPAILPLHVNVADDMDPRPQAVHGAGADG